MSDFRVCWDNHAAKSAAACLFPRMLGLPDGISQLVHNPANTVLKFLFKSSGTGIMDSENNITACGLANEFVRETDFRPQSPQGCHRCVTGILEREVAALAGHDHIFNGDIIHVGLQAGKTFLEQIVLTDRLSRLAAALLYR